MLKIPCSPVTELQIPQILENQQVLSLQVTFFGLCRHGIFHSKTVSYLLLEAVLSLGKICSNFLIFSLKREKNNLQLKLGSPYSRYVCIFKSLFFLHKLMNMSLFILRNIYIFNFIQSITR